MPVFRASWLSLFLVLITGRVTPPHLTHGVKKTPEMVSIIQRAVPPGTPIGEAKRFMVSEGFTCSPLLNVSFTDTAESDSLYCCRSDGNGMVRRTWMVSITHNGGTVSEVFVNTGLVGL